MGNYLILLFFYLCFNLYNLKDDNLVQNWDDDFLNPLNILKVKQMLINCRDNPKTYNSIDNLCEAIQHYKSDNGGNSVPATDNLISHMKEFSSCLVALTGRKFYKDVKKELTNSIRNKIKKLKKDNGNKGTTIIKNSPDAFRGAWYLTLGSYGLNIEYEKTIDLSKHNFNLEIHFSGEDLWDFQSKDCKGENIFKHFGCIIDNLFEEEWPDKFLGDGTEYKVSYDFYDTLNIDTDSIFLTQNESEREECKNSNSKYLGINILFIICLLL